MTTLEQFLTLSEPPIVEGWPLPLNHISASSLKMAARCPEQWRRRYVLGEKQPPAAALEWGSADHAAAEHNFVQKVESDTDLPVGEVIDIFDDEFNRRFFRDNDIAEMDFRDEAKTVNEKKSKAGEYKTVGAKLVGLYHEQVAPTVKPLVVEESFELELPSLPVRIDGRIDLIAERRDALGLAASERIIDRKTANRSPGKDLKDLSPEWRLAAGVYQLAKPLPHEWDVSVKTETPKVIPSAFTLPYLEIRAQQTLRFVEQSLATLAYYFETYGPDEPWPGARLRGFMTNGSPCGYCGFKPTCFWWRGES